jgi:hypothetical protein
VDDDDMMMNKKAKEQQQQQQHVPFYDTVGTIFERQSQKSRKVSMSAEFGIGGSIKNSTKSAINSALLDSVMNNYASYKGGSASSATVAPTTTVVGGVGSSSSKNTTATTSTSSTSTKTTANNSHHDLSELLAPPSSQFSTMGSRKSSKENNNNLRRKSISLTPTQEEGESNKTDSLVDLVRIKPLSSPTGLLSPSADPRVYPSSQKVSISAAANTVMASNRVHGARRKSIV